MSIVYEERESDSPYIETIMRGRTAHEGSTIRPAECCWHMVLLRYHGNTHLLVVGPFTASSMIYYPEGAALLWIKFKLGTFMPHMPTRSFLNVETSLPGAANQSFWLNGSAWQFPDYDNADTFVDWLACDGALAYDPIVSAVLQDQPQELSARTLRHRFLQATGQTQTHIRQFERAQQAVALLQQGVSILDTVDAAGYFDQPHLTRALKHWIGYTPAQISHMRRSMCIRKTE